MLVFMDCINGWPAQKLWCCVTGLMNFRWAHWILYSISILPNYTLEPFFCLTFTCFDQSHLHLNSLSEFNWVYYSSYKNVLVSWNARAKWSVCHAYVSFLSPYFSTVFHYYSSASKCKVKQLWHKGFFR